jgi:Fe-S-cluster containining protein
MKTLCFACSQNGTSCCQGTQICLTGGDVLRISQFLNSCNFYTTEMPDSAYLDPGDDPAWITLTIRPDGQRRVLKRTLDKSCTMLGESGCLLPMAVRPLICRLHPYTYTEAGISGVDPACPISRELDFSVVLENLGMVMNEARKWHALLYCELHGDKRPSFVKDGWRLHPELEKLPA